VIDRQCQPALLKVERLQVSYGAVTAVRDLTLSVAQGEAVAILGANGAGKSSTLRALAGLQRPSGGKIWLDGVRIDGWPTDRLVRGGLSFVPDTRDLFPRFSVAENLRMGAVGSHGHAHAASYQARRDWVLELFPALSRLLHRPAWTLSGGEQQMLALARALLAQPRLLLLDEPSLGLAPLVVKGIFEALARVLAEGTTILLAEQTTTAALHLTNYAYVLRNGQIALEGPSATLQNDRRVLELYLSGQ